VFWLNEKERMELCSLIFRSVVVSLVVLLYVILLVVYSVFLYFEILVTYRSFTLNSALLFIPLLTVATLLATMEGVCWVFVILRECLVL